MPCRFRRQALWLFRYNRNTVLLGPLTHVAADRVPGPDRQRAASRVAGDQPPEGVEVVVGAADGVEDPVSFPSIEAQARLPRCLIPQSSSVSSG